MTGLNPSGSRGSGRVAGLRAGVESLQLEGKRAGDRLESLLLEGKRAGDRFESLGLEEKWGG